MLSPESAYEVRSSLSAAHCFQSRNFVTATLCSTFRKDKPGKGKLKVARMLVLRITSVSH